MALFDIEAEWNTAVVVDGPQYVIGFAILKLVLYVVNWGSPVKVQSTSSLSICIIISMCPFRHVREFMITGAYSLCCGRYGAGPISQPLMQDIFSCIGSEGSLSECLRNPGRQCDHGQDFSVICSKQKHLIPANYCCVLVLQSKAIHPKE